MKRVFIAIALCGAILAFAGSPALATGVHLTSVEKQVLQLVAAYNFQAHSLSEKRSSQAEDVRPVATACQQGHRGRLA